jgi:hypothetical protein
MPLAFRTAFGSSPINDAAVAAAAADSNCDKTGNWSSDLVDAGRRLRRGLETVLDSLSGLNDEAKRSPRSE